MTSLIPYEKTLPPEIPDDWDFTEADAEFDSIIRDWRRLKGKGSLKLWFFYNKLKVQGRRTDLSQNCEKLPTWLEWLESKGIASNTPLNHFKALGWLPSEEPPKKTPFYLTEPRHEEIKEQVDLLIKIMTVNDCVQIPIKHVLFELGNLKDQIDKLTSK